MRNLILIVNFVAINEALGALAINVLAIQHDPDLQIILNAVCDCL